MNLTKRETDALEALCDTFVPSLAFEAGEDPALFSISARDMGVAGKVAQALDLIDSSKRSAFRLFLGLLENPIFIASLVARAARFSRLSLSMRERVLLRLARSALPQLRTAYQGARSLVMLHTYAADGTPESDALLLSAGYDAKLNPKATAPRIPVARVSDIASRIECDVCVVGSGAAGSVVAAELAADGQDVVVLESGSGWSGDDFDQHELVGMRELFREGGLAGTRDLSMSLLAGSAIGGGTTVNWQSCFRTPDEVRAEWADRSGCDFFTGEAFTESLDAVWRRIAASTDESEINPNNSAISRGAQALGYHWSVIARNALGCDVSQCGNCMFGCRVGGKQSAAATFLSDALRSGARVIAGFSARRLTQSGGKVTGVEGTYTDSAGSRTVSVRAGKVVLAAGALETPVLLMRSGHRSPHLGEHLFLHPTVALLGAYPEDVEPWKGPPQTIVCDQFSHLVGNYGYRIEAAPTHPGLLAVGIPWTGARAHRHEMQRARNVAPFIVLTRDFSAGRVRVTKKGEPYFDYRLGRQEKRLIKHGMTVVARIHHAAGADRILTLHSQRMLWERERGEPIGDFCQRIERASTAPNRLPLFSAHQMGTCRVGKTPRDAVCDERGAVFGLEGAYVADASLFPASSGVNPMVTIMALARVIGRGLRRRTDLGAPADI
ncbi:MAG TPA: GMC family oxidoreductase [Gemmatimonadaceae bacterium]|nr:GMC family oxidoreductase [Gemmatimonadaceae bacterium]